MYKYALAIEVCCQKSTKPYIINLLETSKCVNLLFLPLYLTLKQIRNACFLLIQLILNAAFYLIITALHILISDRIFKNCYLQVDVSRALSTEKMLSSKFFVCSKAKQMWIIGHCNCSSSAEHLLYFGCLPLLQSFKYKNSGATLTQF